MPGQTSSRPGQAGRAGRRRADDERGRALLREMADAQTSALRRSECRDDLVRLYLPVAQHCARRFRDRGEALEDLVQVATIGLINAVDRFEVGHGAEFTTYAIPTVVGEIKRHFRDKGWAVRVPRRLQELGPRIGTATADLSQSLGRSPTPREIAAHLGVEVEDVVEGLESANAYATVSLESRARREDEDPSSILDRLGDEDTALENVELRTSLRPLIADLPPHQREVLALRFFEGLTQAQIAERIGVSQMHVSRQLRRTIAALRESLGTP